MKVFAESPGYDFSYILDHYDWASLGPAKVVDLGGSRGHISMALARRFENLDMTVQDMEVMIQGAEADVPEELKARVNFMPHDFFAPQPIEADVFYCRWIFHNWPDKYALIMLRSLIPALKPSSRLLIHESCMPERGEGPLWKEKQLRCVLTPTTCPILADSFSQGLRSEHGCAFQFTRENCRRVEGVACGG